MRESDVSRFWRGKGLFYGFLSVCKCELFHNMYHFIPLVRELLVKFANWGKLSLWTHARAQVGRATTVGAGWLDASGGLDFCVPGGVNCVNCVFKIL